MRADDLQLQLTLNRSGTKNGSQQINKKTRRALNLVVRAWTDIHTRTQVLEEEVIFLGGTEAYHSYRIPAIVRTNAGTLIAFCEGRKDSSLDYGDIDVVYKRSTDDGQNWGSLNLLFSNFSEYSGGSGIDLQESLMEPFTRHATPLLCARHVSGKFPGIFAGDKGFPEAKGNRPFLNTDTEFV